MLKERCQYEREFFAVVHDLAAVIVIVVVW